LQESLTKEAAFFGGAGWKKSTMEGGTQRVFLRMSTVEHHYRGRARCPHLSRKRGVQNSIPMKKEFIFPRGAYKPIGHSCRGDPFIKKREEETDGALFKDVGVNRKRKHQVGRGHPSRPVSQGSGREYACGIAKIHLSKQQFGRGERLFYQSAPGTGKKEDLFD